MWEPVAGEGAMGMGRDHTSYAWQDSSLVSEALCCRRRDERAARPGWPGWAGGELPFLGISGTEL